MPARWGWVAMCPILHFGLGCALLDQPPLEASNAASFRPASKYAPLATLCECGVRRAESELRDALAALESGSSETLQGEGFAACASALTGVPTLSPPASQPRTASGSSFVELDAELEKQGSGWQLSIDLNGTPSIPLEMRARRAKSVDDSPRKLRIQELRLELEDRVEPVARALKDAHLASQLCHATALFVALEAAVRDDRAHAEVIRRSANGARKGDGIAAAATGLVLEVRRAASVRGDGDARSRLARFRALSFDGELESDADDAERVAARHVHALGTSLRDASTPRPYSNDVALPLWLAPRPTPRELCQSPKSPPADAARSGLVGLGEGDLDRVMLGARSLYPRESTAQYGLTALCATLTGDDRRSLRAAREMVPGYSPAGALLASMATERR